MNRLLAAWLGINPLLQTGKVEGRRKKDNIPAHLITLYEILINFIYFVEKSEDKCYGMGWWGKYIPHLPSLKPTASEDYDERNVGGRNGENVKLISSVLYLSTFFASNSMRSRQNLIYNWNALSLRVLSFSSIDPRHPSTLLVPRESWLKKFACCNKGLNLPALWMGMRQLMMSCSPFWSFAESFRLTVLG